MQFHADVWHGKVMKTIPQVLFGSLLEKGVGRDVIMAPKAIEDTSRERQLDAWNIDPNDVDNLLGQDTMAEDHPGAGYIAYDTLRSMAALSTTAPFVNLRVDQVAIHGVRREDRFSIGSEIQLMDREARMTSRDKRTAEQIWAVLNRWLPFRDKLEMLARDSVELDQANARIIFDTGNGKARMGKRARPYGWMPVDASTIRFARPKQEEVERGNYRASERRIVQWMDDQIKRQWNPREMMFGVRHPRTNIYVHGYGYPELVQAVDLISDLVFAKSYNSLYFKNGVHASTILLLKAKMKPVDFRSWKRMFLAQLKGVENSHRVAAMLLNPGDGQLNPPEALDKLDLTMSNRDMEFSRYFSFLYRVLAAVMGVDLSELGLGDPADTGRGAMGERRSSDEVLMSRERGLKPMLQSIEMWLNRWIVWPYDKRFRLRFLGLDGPSREEFIAQKKAMMEILPPNRVLRAMDEDPIPYRYADEVPLNPLAIQAYQMERQGALDPKEEEPQKGDIDWSDASNWKAQQAPPDQEEAMQQAPPAPPGAGGVM